MSPAGAVHPHRLARERALSLLYEGAMKGWTADEVLERLVVPVEGYTADLVAGVGRDTDRLDALIAPRLRDDWPFDRLVLMDKLVLRMATWELAHSAEITRATIIDEAVELAKTFGNDESASFVNGVLNAIADQVRAG